MPDLAKIFIAATIVGAVVYYLIQRKKDPVRKIEHSYFSRLWLWPPGAQTRWEAELDAAIRGIDKRVGMHSETTHEEVPAEEPTETEVTFCKDRMANLDELFMLSKPAIEEAWKQWVKQDMPQDWRSVLSLDGFSVPRNGEIEQPWGVTYFCEPAGHYFSIKFEQGKPSLESVDG